MYSKGMPHPHHSHSNTDLLSQPLDVLSALYYTVEEWSASRWRAPYLNRAHLPNDAASILSREKNSFLPKFYLGLWIKLTLLRSNILRVLGMGPGGGIDMGCLLLAAPGIPSPPLCPRLWPIYSPLKRKRDSQMYYFLLFLILLPLKDIGEIGPPFQRFSYSVEVRSYAHAQTMPSLVLSPTYAAEKMLSKASLLALVLIAAAILYHWFEPQAREWLEGKSFMEKKRVGKKIAIG